MDQPSISSSLADLHLPAIRYFDSLDSTNDEARRWIDDGAPTGALIIANEQTAGRGRLGRRWSTPPGAGLAFSLALLSPPLEPSNLSRLVGLGALAVCDALHKEYDLPAQIKWPNDILISRRKVAGVLVESLWNGQVLKAAIVGIGINIAPNSINAHDLPPAELNFPAACIEDAIGHPVSRIDVLHAVLYEFMQALPGISGSGFIEQWESRLAFRDQWVELSPAPPGHSLDHSAGKVGVSASRIMGKVCGLAQDGSLKLVTRDGEIITVDSGEIHLRPAIADENSLPQG